MILSLYKHIRQTRRLYPIFLSAVALIASASLVLAVPNKALASGETYTWVDQNTINGTGGVYKSTAVFKKGSGTDFSLSNEVVVYESAGTCKFGGSNPTNPPVVLSVNTDASNAALKVTIGANADRFCVENYNFGFNLDSSPSIGGTNPYKNGTPPPTTGDPSDCSAYGEATTRQTCQIGFDAQKNQPAEAYNLCDGSRLQQITSGTDGTHDQNTLRAACFRGMTLAVTEQFNNIAEEYARAKCNSGETGVIQARCLSSNTDIFKGFVKECSDQNATVENPDERSTKIRECLAVKAPEVAASINKVGNPTTTVPNATAGTTCAVDGIGWILCPVMRFMAKVTDSVYGVVADMLTVNPVDTSTNSPMYQAWSAMRNFANVAFVIAFLIIIFSQVTSIGISNYGIKKLLPKLIMVAILVNTSYWLCAIAVDVSNILGNSLKGVIEGAGNQIFVSADSVSTGGGGVWDALTVGILAGAAGVAVLYLGLTVLLPILISVLFIIISAVVVLTLRQALIVLLVVVAPLALVALLLPNTESMFKKWRGLFQTLLVMFPIIAVVFGASKLASIIITGAAANGNNIVLQMMGAAVTILPLVLFPKLMSLVGDIGNKVGAFINNPNKGPFDRMRKGAEGLRKDRQNVRNLRALNGGKGMPGRGAKVRYGVRRDAIRNGREAELNRAKSAYIANQAQNNPKFANAIAGGTMFASASAAALSRALSNAKFTIEKAEAEEVKAEHAFVDSLDESALNKIIQNGNGEHSDAKVAAALERLVKVGSTESIQNAVDRHTNNGTGPSVVTKSLANALAADGPQFLKASDIDNIARGQLGKTRKDANGNSIVGADGREVIDQRSFSETASANIEAGVYSQEKLVSANGDELNYAYNVTSDTGKLKMSDTATALEANEVLRGKIKHNANEIHTIATSHSRATTATTPVTTPINP